MAVAACNDDRSEDRDKASFFQLDPSVAVNAGGTANVAAVIVNRRRLDQCRGGAEPCDSKITAAKDRPSVYQPPTLRGGGSALGSSCLIVKSET
jgi:hypothetical protein